jgi:hypothetical protein
MENLLSPKEIKEQVQKFESTLFAVRKFLESARRVGLPAWQLDIKEIEILVADFEGELLGCRIFSVNWRQSSRNSRHYEL